MKLDFDDLPPLEEERCSNCCRGMLFPDGPVGVPCARCGGTGGPAPTEFGLAVLELVDRHVLRLAEIRKAGPEKRREFGGL